MQFFAPQQFTRSISAVAAVAGATLLLVGLHASAADQKAAEYEVGLAKVDVTPNFPIRLSGFPGRLTESVGVRQRIFARAMAIRPQNGQPAVVVTIDSLGIPQFVRD